MPKIMTHRPLPLREGRVLNPGIYTVTGTPAWVAVHTDSTPSLLMGTMSFEQLAKAEQEGWCTELREHAGYCTCQTCNATRVVTAGKCLPAENPFAGDVDIRVTPTSIAALDNTGALIGSIVV